MDSMSYCGQSALIALWGPKGTGQGKIAMALLISGRSSSGREILQQGDVLSDSMSSGREGQLLPPSQMRQWTWETATQRFSSRSESAYHLEWQLLFFLGGEEREAEDKEDCEDSLLPERLSRVRHPLSLGIEPWDEDASTALTEGDGEER
ncbi:UNVERIFIED_CONTAM: hypothetical protein FKN15_026168 [Acipenser sinensis]